MIIDFGRLGGDNFIDTVLSPREIFGALPKQEKSYQYLRDVQAEVLTQWFERRDNKDVVLKMNTGSGKTVVGLLMLKSCLNEGKGPAVYVSPDPYLVQQVLREARLLGLEVTEDTDDLRFRRGRAILVINIYKLINGKSVFGVADEGAKINIGSIVIDDAHACLATTEGQFALTLNTSHECYEGIFNLFREDIYKQSETSAMDIELNDPHKTMLVPFWAWIGKISQVRQILHGVRNDDQIKFVWPLIKEDLLLCNCVFGGGQIEISPICLPIWVIPSLINAERRIFMSATLSDDSILVSHFNIDPESVATAITPSSADDIGDRMILIPQELNPNWDSDQLKEFFKKLSTKYNVVVIVPSLYRARYWSDVANDTLTANNLHSGVQQLKNGHVGLVVLVNKYDGIDLPYDACRILVIDGLPDVRRKIDKIEEAILHGSDELLHSLIQRIEQGMGRGTRANDDHCVIFLIGHSLTNRLYSHGALEKFTPATKAQLDLSEKLSEQLRGKNIEDVEQVINYSLYRNTDWVKASRGILVQVKYRSEGTISPTTIKRRQAFEAARVRDYTKSIQIMQEAVNEVDQEHVKGWLKQQLAMYEHFVNPVEAQVILKSGVSLNHLITHPIDGIDYVKLYTADMDQAQQCLTFLTRNFTNPNELIIGVNSLLEDVMFIPDTAPRFEQAIKMLANFIGFNGQRPEAEFNQGPDVLWEVGQLRYFVIECKNGATNNIINKKDCNQLGGSMNWFALKYDKTCTAVPIMIHPVNLFDQSGSPHQDTRVITSEKLLELKEAVRNFIRAIAALENFGNHKAIAELLRNFNLTRESFIASFTLPYRLQR